MRAVAKTRREPGVDVIEAEADPIGDEDVLLRMESASICGSDLGFYNYTAAYQRFAKVPVIMGHEFAGRVERAGRGVKDFSTGERVSVESVLYCGGCRYCRSGLTNICQNFTVFGMHRNGGFAEYVSVHRKFLHRIPDRVSSSEAGVVEPLSITVNALDDVAELSSCESAAIIGPGPLGLFSAELLRVRGLIDLFVLGIAIDSFRLAIAREKLGYRTFDMDEKDPKEEILAATGNLGCDLVVVAAGAPGAMRAAVPLVAKGGQILALGIPPEDVPLPVAELVRRQVSVRGSYGSAWKHYERAIALLEAKKVRVGEIVTHRFDLADAAKAFEMAKDKTGCKVQFKT